MRALLIVVAVAAQMAMAFAGGSATLEQKKKNLQKALAEYAFAMCGKDRIFVLPETQISLTGRADGTTDYTIAVKGGDQCKPLLQTSSASR
jgi:hypothetical protein